MRLHPLDWLLAGSTVALGFALMAAPVAITPKLASLYALHGALGNAPALSRWMMFPLVPPLMAAGPMALAVYCTVTRMRPRRRLVVLVLTLLSALGATALFVRGLLGPILSLAGGTS